MVRKNDFFLHLVLTKDDQVCEQRVRVSVVLDLLSFQLIMPFSRRPIQLALQPLMEENDASLLIRAGPLDLRFDYGAYYPNKKIIRIIDER